VSTLSTLIQHNLRIPSKSNKTGEEIKGIQIGKEQVKLFADGLIPKKPKKTPKKS
jgi:hypothetical protein